MSRPRRLLSRFAVVAAATALASCQALLTNDMDQCGTNYDCTSRGGAFANSVCRDNLCVGSIHTVDGSAANDDEEPDPKWGCLGRVRWPAESRTETVVYRKRFVRYVGRTPLDGLRVLACSSLDARCETPTAASTTGADGDIALSLPRNFRGYLRLTEPPPDLPDMLPTFYAILPPPDEDTGAWPSDDPLRSLFLPGKKEIDALAETFGAKLDPELGILSGLTLDCQLTLSRGISLSASARGPTTTAFYQLGGGIPSSTADETDDTGMAGFVNLPAGVLEIAATRRATTQRIGQIPVLIQPGVYTVANLPPSP